MLSTKEKAKLKAHAMDEKSVFQIGKNNLSDNLIDGLIHALESRELIKINILKSTETSKEDIAKEIEERTKSHLIEVKGNTAVFYKRSKKNRFSM